MKFTADYEKLLNKYCGDNDIFKLIEECILTDLGEREATYNRYGRYPEQRDRLMKLKNDLLTQRREIDKSIKRRAK